MKLVRASLLVCLIVMLGFVTAHAQEPSVRTVQPSAVFSPADETITYQGLLRQSGAPASGTFDFQFTLYDAASGGTALQTISTANITVTAGLFTTQLQFNEGRLNGEARWLELAVKPSASGSYTILAPRQPVTAAPLALALPGLRTEQNSTSNNLIGGYSGNVLNSSAVGITINGGGTNGSLNSAYDNYSTIGGGLGNTVGSNDAVAASDVGGTVSGGSGNTVSQDYASIGGGQTNSANGGWSVIGGGQTNLAYDDYNVIGGGQNNVAGQSGDTTTQTYATVSGGSSNTASARYATVGGGVGNIVSSTHSTVGGGISNIITNTYSVIGGGQNNQVWGSSATLGGGQNNVARGQYNVIGGGFTNATAANGSTIGGGYNNEALGLLSTVAGGNNHNATNTYSTVGGGNGNTASGAGAVVAGGQNNVASSTLSGILGGSGNSARGEYATILGGQNNSADGAYSIAGGQGAQAQHPGAFVWGGSQDTDAARISSTAPNQFIVRANGGMWVGSGTEVTIPDGALIATDAGAYLSKGGSWSNASDRALKTNFATVSGRAVLEKIAAMPIQSWNYYTEGDTVRHIGPMAQDFYAAFSVGTDDRHIATVDADGVALAAIQGLNEIATEQAVRLEQQDTQMAALEQRLAALEQRGPSAGLSGLTLALTLGMIALAGLGLGWGLGRRSRKGGAA